MSINKKKQELSITVKKEDDISNWYTQVIQKANLMDYTKVSGCIVFKPNSYQIWEKIQDFFNKKIKKSGVQNVYFPSLIPESLLTKEKEHVEGFTPEVAWVTHAGNTKLKERLAIRPTSETIMYDSYNKWIKSYRDLPLRYNQWNNIVRWEFKHSTPFLRNREFLWQEGHTAFATQKEADDEVLEILEYYSQIYEELLAIPVDKGRKSIGEKFAGANYTTTVEGIAQDGKSIQAGTSHQLGQNFAKAFDISFLDKNQKKQFVWQNSWGLSTRTIGAMILVHGDNKGLIVPPNVANNKIVIIPLLFKGKEEKVLNFTDKLNKQLEEFNPIYDTDPKSSAGFKFNQYEIQGIPLRIEVGPKDIENNQITIVQRDTCKKEQIQTNKSTNLNLTIQKMLKDMHNRLYNKAKKMMDDKTIEVNNINDFKKAINEKKRCLVPWYESIESEDEIKELTGASTSCIPFKYNNKSLEGIKCFYSNQPATCWAFFAKSN